MPKHGCEQVDSAQGCDMAHFFGDMSQREKLSEIKPTLKVSRPRKKKLSSNFSQKTNGWICFSILTTRKYLKLEFQFQFKFQVFPSRQDRKTNLIGFFGGKVTARQFCFEIYWPLERSPKDFGILEASWKSSSLISFSMCLC